LWGGCLVVGGCTNGNTALAGGLCACFVTSLTQTAAIAASAATAATAAASGWVDDGAPWALLCVEGLGCCTPTKGAGVLFVCVVKFECIDCILTTAYCSCHCTRASCCCPCQCVSCCCCCCHCCCRLSLSQYETLVCTHEVMSDESSRSAFIKQAQHVSVTQHLRGGGST
jgi:hypothetical protein